MSAAPSDFDAIRALAVAYCDAIHNSKPEVFEEMCHEKFSMTAIAPDGTADFWDKAAYLARVGGRVPFPGEPSFGIYDLDVAAGEMARVHQRAAILGAVGDVDRDNRHPLLASRAKPDEFVSNREIAFSRKRL